MRAIVLCCLMLTVTCLPITVHAAEIHGRIWDDINRDGIMDAAESRLSGWTVFLDLDQDGLRAPGEPAETTDAAGEYTFAGLAPGTYRAVMELPVGWRQTSPAVPGEYSFTVRDVPLPDVSFDFEELAHSQDYVQIPPYERDGMTIHLDTGRDYEFYVWGSTNSRWPGSFALHPAWGIEIVIERVDGGLFTLSSIDLANMFLRNNPTMWITFTLTGTKKGGQTVTEDFGGYPGYFQTFPLTQMVDVKTVVTSAVSELETFSHIDNLVIESLKDDYVNADFGAFLLPAPFVVTTLDDELDGNYSPDDISLREALELTTLQEYGDIIEFDPSLSGGTLLLDPALGQIEIAGDVEINGLGAANLTIDANQNSRVFYIGPALSTVVLRGMTITGGLISGNFGGGIKNPSSYLTIEDSVITGNQATGGPLGAGGGVYSEGYLTLRNCTISDNSSTGRGGGVSVRTHDGVFVNCLIENNSSALGGGGINADGEQMTIDHCTITGNSALSSGGGIECGGDSLSVVDCIITENTASAGGGISNTAGILTIQRSRITDNEATGIGGGGGIYCGGLSRMRILDSSICLNFAENGTGGGIQTFSGTWISNTTIAANLSTGYGGGICFEMAGNALDPNVVVRNSTIVGNVAPAGSGVYANNNCSPEVHNTVIAVNFLFDLSILDVAGDFDPASSHNFISAIDGSTGLAGNNSIYGVVGDPLDPVMMPLVTDPAILPYYEIAPNSPLIDAGDNALALDPNGSPLVTDQIGSQRILSGTVDIGAIEFKFAGDLNGDGTVDIVDLNIILIDWGRSGGAITYPRADSNSDGTVDIVDLNTVLIDWGKTQ